jgi:hypothetical protein
MSSGVTLKADIAQCSSKLYELLGESSPTTSSELNWTITGIDVDGLCARDDTGA